MRGRESTVDTNKYDEVPVLPSEGVHPDAEPFFEFDWSQRLLELRRIYTDAEACGVAYALKEWERSHCEKAALEEYTNAFHDVLRYYAEYGGFLHFSQRPEGAPPLLQDANFEDL